MFGRARVAVKYFVLGLVIGLLFAPRRGEETRKDLLAWIGGMIGGGLGK